MITESDDILLALEDTFGPLWRPLESQVAFFNLFLKVILIVSQVAASLHATRGVGWRVKQAWGGVCKVDAARRGERRVGRRERTSNEKTRRERKRREEKRKRGKEKREERRGKKRRRIEQKGEEQT